jgi:hypothetical protein
MADDRRARETASVNNFGNICSHERIIHLGVVRRMSVVSQVGSNDMKSLRQLGGDAEPVIGRTEQSMQEHERFALADLFEV